MLSPICSATIVGMTITKDTTILDLANTCPDTIPFLVQSGLRNLADNEVLQAHGGSVSVGAAAGAIGTPLESLIESLRGIVGDSDAGVKQIRIQGLLPCPVRMPMLDLLDDAISAYTRSSGNAVQCDLQAAFVGTDWMSEEMESVQAAEQLPEIFLSAGFRLFLTDPRFVELRRSGWFADRSGWDGVNRFAEQNGLADPDRRYTVIGVVPAIFMVNTDLLGDRPMPRSWKDALDPSFANSLALPVTEFDLFDALLLGISKMYGDDGLERLGRSLHQQMHPSQMIAGASRAARDEGPTVTIMPYFFAKTVPEHSPLVPVWPEDGALTAPILMITRADSESIQPLIDAIASREMSDVLSKRGFFPSTHPENSDFDGDAFPLQWPGWDVLRSDDLSERLDQSAQIFHKAASGAMSQR